MIAIWEWWKMTMGIIALLLALWLIIVIVYDSIKAWQWERNRKDRHLCLRCYGAGYIYQSRDEQREMEDGI